MIGLGGIEEICKPVYNPRTSWTCSHGSCSKGKCCCNIGVPSY